MPTTLDKLLAKQQQITNRIKQEEAKEKMRQRKIATRQKIILGSLLESMMQQDEALRADINRRLETFLTRQIDRQAFGLLGGDVPVKSQESAA